MPTQEQFASYLQQPLTVLTFVDSPPQGGAAVRFPVTGDYRIVGAGKWGAATIGQGISAIYVSPDAECVIYKSANWTGESKILTGDNPFLPEWWNDQTASLEVRVKQGGGAVAGDFPPAPLYVNGQITNQAQIDAWYAAHPGYRERQNGGNVVQPPPPANPYGLPPAAALGRVVSPRNERAYTNGYDSVLREAGALPPLNFRAVSYDVQGWQFFNLGRQDALARLPRRYGHGPVLDGYPTEANFWFELYPSLLGKGTTLDRVAQLNQLGQVGQFLEVLGVRWQFLGDVPSDYRLGHRLSGPRGAIRRLAERDYGNDLRRYGGPAFVGALDRSGPVLLSPAALDTLVPGWEGKLSRVVERYDLNDNGNNNGATLPLLR